MSFEELHGAFGRKCGIAPLHARYLAYGFANTQDGRLRAPAERASTESRLEHPRMSRRVHQVRPTAQDCVFLLVISLLLHGIPTGFRWTRTARFAQADNVNDLNSQFAFRLARDEDARRNPKSGCSSAAFWLIVGAVALGILAATRH
jgi:hypothetical protein